MALMTADDWLKQLEDGERWLELVEGRLVRLSPPDEVHGNVVRNLAAALSRQFRKEPGLFAAFELGLHVKQHPDTVRSPALSCFRVDGGVQELDLLLTTRRPELVIEVASSNDRRDAMTARIQAYQAWGVRGIWVFDPASRHAHVFLEGALPRMYKDNEKLTGHPLVPGFVMTVGDVFVDPKWAANKPPVKNAAVDSEPTA